jgi:hypothetical protein
VNFRIAKESIIVGLAILIIAIVYGQTVAPSVIQIDSGELAAVQAVLGIAHPTGYPLFTLLGYLFSGVPLSGSKIFQLNLLSLFWCVLSVTFFWKSFYLIYQGKDFCWHQNKRKKDASKRKIHVEKPLHSEKRWMGLYAGFLGAAFLAFSRTFWLQSTAVEVYSLHLFLLSLIVYFLCKFYQSERQSIGLYGWIGIALGLGFANHMTTLLILPGMFFLFFSKERFRRSTLNRLFLVLSVMLLVCGLFYCYLPIRAAQKPVLNWGNPVDLGNFIRHVSGKQYRVWLFSSSAVAKKNLIRFFHCFPDEFSWFGVLLGIVGIYYTLLKMRRLALFLLLSFFTTLFYAINYDIHDLESYFLLAYWVFGMFIAFGIWRIVSWTWKWRWRFILLVLFPLGVVYEGFRNYSEVDQSQVTIFEDYTKGALQSLPEEAVLLSYQWDTLISPATYFQWVEGFRKDVMVVDKELLRRSWYFNQLKGCYPEVMENIVPETQRFIEALLPFERGGDFNPAILEKRYRRLIARLIETGLKERAVFIAPELVEGELRRGEIYLPPGVHLIPDLYFFRVVHTEAYVPLRSMEVKIRFPGKHNDYTLMIRNFMSKMLMRRIRYEHLCGKKENIRMLREVATSLFLEMGFPEGIEKM